VIDYPVPRILSRPSIIPMRDLELFHHFTFHACLTLPPLGGSRGLEKQYFWQSVAPSLAQSYDFLLHSIMAFSALHIAHTRPSCEERYCNIAYYHHSQALGLFRTAIIEITPSNCSGLFATSALINFFSLGTRSVSGLIATDDVLGSFINILTVLKSSWSHFAQARFWIENGPIGQLPFQRKSDLLLNRTPGKAGLCDVFDRWDAFNQTNTEEQDSQMVYQRSIQGLKQYFRLIPEQPSGMAHVLWWLQSLDSDYMDMLQRKRPMVLFILANWCVSIQYAPGRWFMKGWIEKVIESIITSMDPTWRHELQWSLQRIRNQFQASLV
jgi:hypothetical protein